MKEKRGDAWYSKTFKLFLLDKFQSKQYSLANEEERKVPLKFLLNFSYLPLSSTGVPKRSVCTEPDTEESSGGNSINTVV